MSASIRSTVESAITSAIGTVPAGYGHAVTAIVTALEEREFNNTDALVGLGQRYSSYSALQIKGELGRNTTLEFRPAPVAPVAEAPAPSVADLESLLAPVEEPAPEAPAQVEDSAPESDDADDVEVTDSNVKSELSKLKKQVKKLKKLAKRHLGADL